MFEKYGSDSFTVVGLALDSEGIPPAKLYYDRFGVTFPALVDPDYATGFGAVPKTFFVDEHGKVLDKRDWEQQLAGFKEPQPVTAEVRSQWSDSGKRLGATALRRLSELSAESPADLNLATDLGSRYLALGLHQEAQKVLRRAVAVHDEDLKAVAEAGGRQAELLSQAYFQMARTSVGERNQAVRFATLSFYLNPTVGFGKQIARLIAPKRFDGRPAGDFDNDFREGTLKRLKKERRAWLGVDAP